MPPTDGDTMDDFLSFSRQVILGRVKKLHVRDLKDFEFDILPGMSYDHARKLTLKKLCETEFYGDISEAMSKCFIKDEGYGEPKFPRSIMSPTDKCKIFISAVVRAVEENFFHGSLEKYFVKKIDPRSYPNLLKETLGNRPVFETDYSSMEAHHFGKRAEAFRFLMMHCIRELPISNGVKRLIDQLLRGTNVMKYNSFVFYVFQRLMSGVSWTSLSNAVLNFLLTSYMVLKTKYPKMNAVDLSNRLDEFSGLFEGDDGIFNATEIDENLIKKLGLKLKYEKRNVYYEASFCGNNCSKNCDQVLVDPRKVMRSFFMLPAKFKNSGDRVMNAQLRAKAMSYYYNYSGVPIVGPLAWQVLNLTSGYSIDRAKASENDLYRREKFQRAETYLSVQDLRIRPEIKMESRIDVEKRFGFSIQTQLDMEREIYSSKTHFVLDVNLSPEEILLNNHMDDESWITPMPSQDILNVVDDVFGRKPKIVNKAKIRLRCRFR
jgi:hypothetical protein